MRCELANTAQGNREYQREMAAALINSEGQDAALQTCLNNGWEGETQRAARAAERRQHGGEPFAAQARIRPQRTAIEDGTRRLTYGALDRLIRRLADLLATRGVERGSRVAILTENRLEYLE